MLTQRELKRLVAYDPETGCFTQRVRTSQRIKVGDRIGWKTMHGYHTANINKTAHRLHRLAWLYVYGEWPDGPLDHINNDRGDNRISNLRLSTPSKNAMNRKCRSDSRSGIKGITWNEKEGVWRATIGINGKRKTLGRFSTAQEAHAAYCEAARLIHGEFARTS